MHLCLHLADELPSAAILTLTAKIFGIAASFSTVRAEVPSHHAHGLDSRILADAYNWFPQTRLWLHKPRCDRTRTLLMQPPWTQRTCTHTARAARKRHIDSWSSYICARLLCILRSTSTSWPQFDRVVHAHCNISPRNQYFLRHNTLYHRLTRIPHDLSVTPPHHLFSAAHFFMVFWDWDAFLWGIYQSHINVDGTRAWSYQNYGLFF